MEQVPGKGLILVKNKAILPVNDSEKGYYIEYKVSRLNK